MLSLTLPLVYFVFFFPFLLVRLLLFRKWNDWKKLVKRLRLFAIPLMSPKKKKWIRLEGREIMHSHWVTGHVLHWDCAVHSTPFLQALLLQFWWFCFSIFIVCTKKPLLKGNLKKSSTLSQRKVKVRNIFCLNLDYSAPWSLLFQSHCNLLPQH